MLLSDPFNKSQCLKLCRMLFPRELLCVHNFRPLSEPDDPIVMKLCGIWGGVPLLIYDIEEFIRAVNLTYSFETNHAA